MIEESVGTKSSRKDYKLHELKFTTTERILPLVPMPPSDPLVSERFWLAYSLPNIPLIRSHLLKEGRILKHDFILLLEIALKLFSAEHTLLEIKSPITSISFYNLFLFTDY